MKSFLIKMVNPYVFASLIVFLLVIGIICIASITDVALFKGDSLLSRFALLIAAPVIGVAFMIDPWYSRLGTLNPTIDGLSALFLYIIFPVLFWSLPVWGIIYIVQRLKRINTA